MKKNDKYFDTSMIMMYGCPVPENMQPWNQSTITYSQPVNIGFIFKVKDENKEKKTVIVIAYTRMEAITKFTSLYPNYTIRKIKESDLPVIGNEQPISFTSTSTQVYNSTTKPVLVNNPDSNKTILND